MRQTDFGQVANSYARSREDIPVTLMDSLLLRNIFFAGKKVADIGAGTGGLTRKIAMRKADLVGVDPSLALLEQAKAFNQTKNFTIPFLHGTAEATGLGDSQYDVVTVMRAWHWFDREKAMLEVKRILKRGGTLIVIDSGFLSDMAAVEKTFEVLAKYVAGGLKPAGSKAESKQRINGFPVEWFAEWQKNGFELRDFYKLNYTVSFTKEEWIQRVESISWLADLEETVQNQALAELVDLLPDEERYVIPHECNVCILRVVE
ncbi:2-methoxy-6-polyprenyl-1,4-benzoquinol methylase, mitochondrial [Neobacillus rhizosphaerae]|uniref:2-methoxy-6-polyprenyl-1,4-benzoquinol methylase, mitochondrial n=1 Tax=Neobacillus rhizosphaerae TaxID=2880965 RepID=A0ABM9EYB0_9BACI|nr:class I SAM-dependent methyltransferase [Neobacillus rhizosphaerae]CAH2717176.1 2-methoxy-6-polyprenyl-1,4-benzoquinol methylase, mitochondrial [Neobacillus rhizosphaerae]